ncbi:hypothetical protein ABPG74_019248 [Tetrahymena malaccensis]
MCRQIKDSFLSQSDNISKVSVNQNELKSQNDNLTGHSIIQEEQNLRKDLVQNQNDDNQLKQELIQQKQLGNASLIYQYQHRNSNNNENMQKTTEKKINIEHQKKEDEELQNNIVINIQNQNNQQFSELSNPQISKQEIEQESRSNKQLMKIEYHLAKDVSLTKGSDKHEILEDEYQKNRSQQEIEKECLKQQDNCLDQKIKLTEISSLIQINKQNEQFMREQINNNNNNNNQEQTQDQVQQQSLCQTPNKLSVIDPQSLIYEQQNQSLKSSFQDQKIIEINEQLTLNKNLKQEKKKLQIEYEANKNEILKYNENEQKQSQNQSSISKQESFDKIKNVQNVQSNEQKQITKLQNNILDKTNQNEQKQSQNLQNKIETEANLEPNNVQNEINQDDSNHELKALNKDETFQLNFLNQKVDYKSQQKLIHQFQIKRKIKTIKKSSKQCQKSKKNANQRVGKLIQRNKQFRLFQSIKQQTNTFEFGGIERLKNQKKISFLKKKFKSYTKQYLFMSFYNGDKFICDVDFSIDYSEFNESFDQDFSFFQQNSDNQNIEQNYLDEDTQQQQKQADFLNPNNIGSNQLEFQQNDAKIQSLDEQNQAELANQVFTEEKNQKGNQKDGILKLEDSQQKLSINQYDGQWLDQIKGLEVNQINNYSQQVTSGENQQVPDQIQEDFKQFYLKNYNMPKESFQECLIQLYQRCYRISRFVRKGGFGAVFEGYHTKDQTKVAIKFSFPINNCSSEQTQQIFEDMKSERNIIDQIKCYQYIVKTFDLFIIQKSHIIVQIMEYCETDLQEYIKKRKEENKSLSKEEIIDIYFQLINALIEIHANNIVHLDIKPQNILRSYEGVYKLTDFGISQLIRQDNNSCTDQFKGLSQKYCSPEQQYSWQNQELIFDQRSNSKFNYNSELKLQAVSMASDVFSMGLTFLYILQLNLSDEESKQIRNGKYEFDTRILKESKV